jgi:hypothetical protein
MQKKKRDSDVYGSRQQGGTFHVSNEQFGEDSLVAQNGDHKRVVDVSCYDVFLSHSGASKDQIVAPLWLILSSLDCRVFFDRASIPFGEDWSACLATSQSTTRLGVVVVTPDYYTRTGCQDELIGMVQAGVKIFSVVLAEAKDAKIPAGAQLLIP